MEMDMDTGRDMDIDYILVYLSVSMSMSMFMSELFHADIQKIAFQVKLAISGIKTSNWSFTLEIF
jgi:hypothetical protein